MTSEIFSCSSSYSKSTMGRRTTGRKVLAPSSTGVKRVTFEQRQTRKGFANYVQVTSASAATPSPPSSPSKRAREAETPPIPTGDDTWCDAGPNNELQGVQVKKVCRGKGKVRKLNFLLISC